MGEFSDPVKSSKSDATCLENTRCYFCEFCDNTSIHGFKFLGERRRYIIEKIWWLLMVVGAVSGSGVLIYKAYKKWDTSPVVINFSSKETAIWEIPFPAVTICPETKLNNTIFNYTNVYKKFVAKKEVTQEERDYFNMFQMVCDDLPFDEETDFNQSFTIPNEYFLKFIGARYQLPQAICKWMGEQYDCSELLYGTFTADGYCYTFNMLHGEDIYKADLKLKSNASNATKSNKWSLENGYSTGADLDTYPRRTIISGIKGGLQLDLFSKDSELDYVCGEVQGYKVTLHHPGEEPDLDKHFRVPLNQVVEVAIKPSMIKTSEVIRAYRAVKRKCYLPGEKELYLYKIYTQQSCMFECLLNYTTALCGCSPVYTVSALVCGPKSKTCVDEAKVTFFELDILNANNSETEGSCGCLPACTTLEFDAETTQVNWEWRKSLQITDKTYTDNKYTEVHISRLTVYYKEMQFMTSERNELYGVVDFLANCGGLLGLFCGFSFISSMEIFYYLTLRLVCNFKKFGRRIWSGAPELLEK